MKMSEKFLDNKIKFYTSVSSTPPGRVPSIALHKYLLKNLQKQMTSPILPILALPKSKSIKLP